MKCLARNKTTFKYCQYIGKTPIVDNEGYDTGEYTNTYQSPIELKACISAIKGTDTFNTFGISLDYDKTITIDNVDTPIDEHSLIFVDKQPEYDETTQTLQNKDYIVIAIALSKNVMVVAIRKVKENAS